MALAGHMEASTTGALSETETEVHSSYSSSTIMTSSSSTTTILSTKELNRLISETSLDKSLLEPREEELCTCPAFPFGKPVFTPDPIERSDETNSSFPPLIIDEGNTEKIAKKSESYTSSGKSKKTSSPGTPTSPAKSKSKSPASPVQNGKFVRSCASPVREHSYDAATIASEKKSIGSFPLPSRKSPERNSPTKLEMDIPHLLRKEEMPATVDFSSTSVSEMQCEEATSEEIIRTTITSSLETSELKCLKSLPKSPEKPTVRPNSLQIPIDPEYEINTTKKGATKYTAARKISFESPQQDSPSRIFSENFKSSTPIKSQNQTQWEKQRNTKTSENFLNSSNKIIQEEESKRSPNRRSVASQTRPCIVTPISSIKNLSASQDIHRRNLYHFSNQQPSFLRSTESSRQHSIVTPTRVIEEVKYLKDTSFLTKKSSSLPSVASPTTTPRKSRSPLRSPQKYAFGSPIPPQHQNKDKFTMNTNSQHKSCSHRGQVISINSGRQLESSVQYPDKLACTYTSKTSVENMPSYTSPGISSMKANWNVKTPPKRSNSFTNSSTYVSPTSLASYSRYVENLNNALKNTKNSNPTTSSRKLSPSKVIVTSISPTPTFDSDRKTSSSESSYSFKHYNEAYNRTKGENYRSSLTKTSNMTNMTVSSNSYHPQRISSSAERRVSDSALKVQMKKPSFQRYSFCNNMMARTNSFESNSSPGSSISPTIGSIPPYSYVKSGR